MWYLIVVVVFAFLLPGLIVHVQSLKFLKKNGEDSAIWQSLSPLSFFFILVVAIPVYSFGFFSLLFHSQFDRVAAIRLSYEQLKMQKENVIRLSVIVGFASLFGVKLEELEK